MNNKLILLVVGVLLFFVAQIVREDGAVDTVTKRATSVAAAGTDTGIVGEFSDDVQTGPAKSSDNMAEPESRASGFGSPVDGNASAPGRTMPTQVANDPVSQRLREQNKGLGPVEGVSLDDWATDAAGLRNAGSAPPLG